MEDLAAENQIEAVLDDIDGVQNEAEDWEDEEDCSSPIIDPAAVARELVEIQQFRTGSAAAPAPICGPP